MQENTQEYLQRKKFVDKLLTIYGRKPVIEALVDSNLKIYRLHLADSNKTSKIIHDITDAANQRNLEIVYHDRKGLSHISKNSKQDQGVALDIVLEGFIDYQEFINCPPTKNFSLIALDGVTNPQNLGMIIRSVCASPLTGIILPRKGCAKLNSLAIKASAGTLFKASILRCDSLEECLTHFKTNNTSIVGLDLSARNDLHTFKSSGSLVYVLGNESEGLSPKVKNICSDFLKIPMANGVESLNVAVTAGILAFHNLL